MWAVEVPGSFNWPKNGAPGLFLDIYDWDRILLESSVDNILPQKIVLCTILFPCALAVYGGVLQRRGDGSVLCQASLGCTSLALTSLTLSCDSTAGAGPVIDVQSAALVILRTTITDCSSQSDGGAVRCFGGGGTLSVTESSFRGAHSAGVGGAISVIGCSATVVNSSFQNCGSKGAGGAISASQFICYGSGDVVATNLQVRASRFEGCHSTAGGGAISSSSVSTTSSVTGSTFAGCWSNASGGAILAADSASLNISDSSLSGNIASSVGGGIAVATSAVVYVSRCTITGNVALGIGGGGVQTDGSMLLLEDVVAAGNQALNGGGGVLLWVGDSSPTIIDGGDVVTGGGGSMCGVDNRAGYGDCIASAYSQLEVIRGFSVVYAGLSFMVTVLKKDAYNQTISTDSSSVLETVAVLGESLYSDDSVTLSGGYIANLKAGKATFSMQLKPTFTYLDAATGTAVLKTHPTIVFVGNDEQTGQAMISTFVPVPIQSNLSVCPEGSILVLDQPSPGSQTSARPGACSRCGPGTYSVDPLKGTSTSGPSCLDCLSSAKCLGGHDVNFTIGTWTVSGGMYRLEACPPGHQLINSIDGVFSHDVQTCQACPASDYILSTTLSNISCEHCPVGAVCDGNSLQSLVDGAEWVADLTMGVYLLVSCPPGYEMQTVTLDGQQCLVCPSGFFCVGSAEAASACPQGTYAPPGANASAACSAVVFVILVVTLPLTSVEFSGDQQAAFQEAVAAAAGVKPGYVSLSVSSTSRRAAGASIQVCLVCCARKLRRQLETAVIPISFHSRP